MGDFTNIPATPLKSDPSSKLFSKELDEEVDGEVDAAVWERRRKVNNIIHWSGSGGGYENRKPANKVIKYLKG